MGFSSLLALAATQDLRSRRVKNNLWIAAFVLTLLSMTLAFQGIEHLVAVISAAVMGFLFWRVGVWGGADGRWLPVCLAWLPLSGWPIWLFIFFLGWCVYALLVSVVVFLQFKKPGISRRELALMPIMFIAHLSVSALIKLKVVV
ncbi:A24 family peptidase [Bacterioplanoides sp.]|uniref:A24 family peptidase n=1 Tax=Bacterioplanoides sp. TaxID=2066072 RepID=UPI003B006009